MSSSNQIEEPIRMAWITDFTLKCLDRDILIVKECLMNVSSVFKSEIEDGKIQDSLKLDWGSQGIHRVMQIIHVFPYTSDMPNVSFKFEDDEKDMLSFCFKYKIKSIFSHLRKELNKALVHAMSIKWLPFLHEFVDQDGTKLFNQEINIIRELIINDNKIDLYMSMINPKSDISDSDIYVIMKMLKQRLMVAEYRLNEVSCKLRISEGKRRQYENELHDEYGRRGYLLED